MRRLRLALALILALLAVAMLYAATSPSDKLRFLAPKLTDTGTVDTTALASTAVTPASYTCTNLTVDAKGRITAASNGSCSGGSGMTQLAQIVTSGRQTTVDFTSISGAYSMLVLGWIAQDSGAGTSTDGVYLKINNDGTAGNYTSTTRNGSQNASATAGPVISATSNGILMFEIP